MNWLCLPEHGGVGACQVSPVAWKLPALMGSEGYHYTPSQDSIQLGVSARAIAFHHLSLSCSVPFPQLYSSNNDPSTKSATLTSLASSVHPGSGWLPGYHSPPLPLRLLSVHLQSVTLYENLCGGPKHSPKTSQPLQVPAYCSTGSC